MTTKKLTKREKVISMLMEKPNAKRENFEGAIFITYDPLCFAGYRYKRAIKPEYHIRFKTAEQRSKYIDDLKISVKRDADNENRRRAERAAENAKIKEGSILVSSWGYEQTNVDFYVVLKRKNTMAVIQRVGQFREPNRDDSGTCTPDVSKKFDEPFKKKIGNYGIRLTSFSSARLWDGRSMDYSSYA